MENTATTQVSAPAVNAETPVISLTAGALLQIRSVCKEQGFQDYVLTIRVVPTGCSGLGYSLDLVKESKPGDLVWEQDSLRLATDPMSAKYLNGTEMDYVKTDTGEGFRFNNPNAKASCGCGSSFSA